MATYPITQAAYATSGSAWTWTYPLTDSSGNPLNLTGLTFEFVVRPTVTNTVEPGLISVSSTASNSQGSITITPLAGLVTVTLTPAATSLLQDGVYPYGLWSSPGTSTATIWYDGNMTANLAALP